MNTRSSTSSDRLEPAAPRSADPEGNPLPGLTSACRNLLREAAALGLEFEDVLEALRSSDTADHTDLSTSN